MPQRSEECVGSPGTLVTASCKLLCLCWELTLGPSAGAVSALNLHLTAVLTAPRHCVWPENACLVMWI